MSWNLKKVNLVNSGDQKTKETIALLTLSRVEAANSLSAKMVGQGVALIEQQILNDDDCRMVAIYGEGKHFCAGADLKWMKESSTKSHQENINDALDLQKLYEAIQIISVPTIAVVRGAAYGGGVGLIAACDVALCHENAKLCLSEVNIGIIPSVILPYLGRKMTPGSIKLYGLSGALFRGQEAYISGLADCVIAEKDFDQESKKWINTFLSSSCEAQKRLKKLNAELWNQDYTQSELTAKFIADARSSEDGKEGISSFLEKRKPNFVRKLGDSFSF